MPDVGPNTLVAGITPSPVDFAEPAVAVFLDFFTGGQDLSGSESDSTGLALDLFLDVSGFEGDNGSSSVSVSVSASVSLSLSSPSSSSPSSLLFISSELGSSLSPLDSSSICAIRFPVDFAVDFLADFAVDFVVDFAVDISVDFAVEISVGLLTGFAVGIPVGFAVDLFMDGLLFAISTPSPPLLLEVSSSTGSLISLL